MYDIIAYAVRYANDGAQNVLFGLEPLKASADTTNDRGYTLTHYTADTCQFQSAFEASYLQYLGSSDAMTLPSFNLSLAMGRRRQRL